MPESPEVDALADFIASRTGGQVIRSIDIEEFGVIKTRDRRVAELADRHVRGARRLGKHIALETDGPTLVVSFGRAGWARWSDEPESPEADSAERPAAVVVRIEFDDGGQLAITEGGDWLSVGLSVVDDVADVPGIAKLGIDPTSDRFTSDVLDRLVTGRRKRLKTLLQEQESLAGIGNAYSDEILHAARLSPLAHASALGDEERARLFAAIRDVLGGAFAARRGVPIDRLKAEKVASMRVHGRAGETCPVCGDVVRDVPGSKGSAQYCPTCQNGGVALEG